MPVRTVNRQCSSGLQAVADVAAAIKAGFYDIGMSDPIPDLLDLKKLLELTIFKISIINPHIFIRLCLIQESEQDLSP